MFTYEEAKKYFRFVQRCRSRSVYKKQVEDFELIYDKFSRVAKKMGGISEFVSYFSKADKKETASFMKGGCGYFASLLDLLFGNENSGFVIFTLGNKHHFKSPDSIFSENHYERMDMVGQHSGYSHVLYMHEGKYYDACGEYASHEEVLAHCKKYYAEYIKDMKESLTGEYYINEFSNKELWLIEKKNLIKKKGFVHYLLCKHTTNLFLDMSEMFQSMRHNFERNEEREIIFKYRSYVQTSHWW